MPVKYLTSNKTSYSFGGGANEVRVLDPLDTTNYTVDLGGGNDLAIMGLGDDTVFGGGGSDVIEGGRGNDFIYGDVAGNSSSRNLETDTLYGDSAGTLSAMSYLAGNDVIVGASGSANFTNNMYGDALTMNGDAKGGDDKIYGGNLAINTIFGDAQLITGTAVGGNDLLVGGNNGGSNTIYGDAEAMQTGVLVLIGGNDIIFGGNGVTNVLFGDAQNFIAGSSQSVVGGNDILAAGDGGTNTLYGDSRFYTGAAIGGNDRLISGTGNDTMWGDPVQVVGTGIRTGGADTFVFVAGSGQDTIGDFGANDVIDISAYATGVTDQASFDAWAATHIADAGSDLVVNLGAGNTITLAGVADISMVTYANFDFVI